MLKFGILRSPTGHSLSEVMQTAALQHLNIKGEYKAYGVSKEDLKKVFLELKANGVKGLNVTIPHKIDIIPLLDELTERAKLIGAVNTITFQEDGKTTGDNTDVIGFWEAISEEVRKKIPLNKVSILGCGGAAHAVATALILNRTKHIKIYGRNKDKFDDFKRFFLQGKETLQWNISTTIETDLISNIDLSNTFLLVNTTPLGMYPNINDSPIKKDDLNKLPKDSFVYDIIYKPKETKLLQYAKTLGLQTLNGVEMLVRQGAASLNIWLGESIAPIGAMRTAILNELEKTLHV